MTKKRILLQRGKYHSHCYAAAAAAAISTATAAVYYHMTTTATTTATLLTTTTDFRTGGVMKRTGRQASKPNRLTFLNTDNL